MNTDISAAGRVGIYMINAPQPNIDIRDGSSVIGASGNRGIHLHPNSPSPVLRVSNNCLIRGGTASGVAAVDCQAPNSDVQIRDSRIEGRFYGVAVTGPQAVDTQVVLDGVELDCTGQAILSSAQSKISVVDTVSTATSFGINLTAPTELSIVNSSINGSGASVTAGLLFNGNNADLSSVTLTNSHINGFGSGTYGSIHLAGGATAGGTLNLLAGSSITGSKAKALRIEGAGKTVVLDNSSILSPHNDGIYVNADVNLTLRNGSLIQEAGAHGINIPVAGSIFVDNSTITSSSLPSIRADAAPTALEITNGSVLSNSLKVGLELRGSGTDALISNSDIIDNEEHGIDVYAPATVTIQDGSVISKNLWGILVRSSDVEINMQESSLERNNWDGMTVLDTVGATTVTLTSSTIHSNVRSGILMDNNGLEPAVVEIRGCDFFNTGAAGLIVRGSAALVNADISGTTFTLGDRRRAVNWGSSSTSGSLTMSGCVLEALPNATPIAFVESSLATGTLTIRDTVFGNKGYTTYTADYGLYVKATSAGLSLRVEDCDFNDVQENFVQAGSGSLDATFSGCTFSDNYDRPLGFYNTTTSTIINVTLCDFMGGTEEGERTAADIAAQLILGSNAADVAITSCTFYGSADGLVPFYGILMRRGSVEPGTITVSDCTFFNLENGIGVYESANSPLDVQYSIFCDINGAGIDGTGLTATEDYNLYINNNLIGQRVNVTKGAHSVDQIAANDMTAVFATTDPAQEQFLWLTSTVNGGATPNPAVNIGPLDHAGAKPLAGGDGGFLNVTNSRNWTLYR